MTRVEEPTRIIRNLHLALKKKEFLMSVNVQCVDCFFMFRSVR